MAMIMPIRTTTTIATCIQIQVGDMTGGTVLRAAATGLAPAPEAGAATIV